MTDVVGLAQELRTLLAEHVLRWLEERSGLEKLLDIAERRPDQFPRYLLQRFALLPERAGMAELAARVER